MGYNGNEGGIVESSIKTGFLLDGCPGSGIRDPQFLLDGVRDPGSGIQNSCWRGVRDPVSGIRDPTGVRDPGSGIRDPSSRRIQETLESSEHENIRKS